MSDIKYHVNPETGRANQCHATVKDCRFAVNGELPPHFETKVEAKSYYEKNMAEEHGATAKIAKTARPKRLTPAQKERAEGRQHAELRLNGGSDPDELLKYANQHDAFAKGYTARLQEESDKNATALAISYFDANIAHTYGDIPSDHLEGLRNRYVNDVLANPKAREELREETQEKAKNDKDTASTVQRQTIDTKAHTLRVGDIITGEKFSPSGKWVEDDSSEIVKVEPLYGINGQEFRITYDDGYVGTLGPNDNVKVKRDKNRISDKPVSPTVIRNATRKVIDEAEKGYLIKKDDFQKIMEHAKSENAGFAFARNLNRLADAMEDNNQHDASIKASAASTRINMMYDKDYQLDRGQAFDLLYDKDNTDPVLFNKIAIDFPSVARSAATSRENRAEINKQKAERGDTEYA